MRRWLPVPSPHLSCFPTDLWQASRKDLRQRLWRPRQWLFLLSVRPLRRLQRRLSGIRRTAPCFYSALAFIHGPFFWACWAVSARYSRGTQSCPPLSYKVSGPRYLLHTACTMWHCQPW